MAKLNRKKRKLHCENRINDINSDSKKLWNTLKKKMGRNKKPTPSFLETDGTFITKAVDMANYINNYFIDKVGKSMNNMPIIDNELSHLLIINKG